jgi:hypothetical protein
MNSKKRNLSAQAQRLRQHLLINLKVTTIECRDELSIMHPAGRIKELRDQGWPITTAIYQQVDSSGVKHRAADYFLEVEKLTPEQLNILN